MVEANEDVSRWEKRPKFEQILAKLKHHTKSLLDAIELAEKSCKSKAIAKILHEEAKVRSANIFRARQELEKLLEEDEKKR